jgi:hypothetical protein
VNEMRKPSAATDVKKITRGVWLVNLWIKACHAEGEVHRIQIVEFVTSKRYARESYGQGEARWL